MVRLRHCRHELLCKFRPLNLLVLIPLARKLQLISVTVEKRPVAASSKARSSVETFGFMNESMQLRMKGTMRQRRKPRFRLHGVPQDTVQPQRCDQAGHGTLQVQ